MSVRYLFKRTSICLSVVHLSKPAPLLPLNIDELYALLPVGTLSRYLDLKSSVRYLHLLPSWVLVYLPGSVDCGSTCLCLGTQEHETFRQQLGKQLPSRPTSSYLFSLTLRPLVPSGLHTQPHTPSSSLSFSFTPAAKARQSIPSVPLICSSQDTSGSSLKRHNHGLTLRSAPRYLLDKA